MGQFDQTGRQMAKLEGAEFLPWALSCCESPPALIYDGWDDTRRLVVPGEPDQENDTVMKMRWTKRRALPCWLITEIEDEAEPGIFLRVGKYEMALLDEVSPGLSRNVGVLSLVLNLSGKQKMPEYASPFIGWETRIRPLVVDVAAQDATKTLERIEKRELGLTILPFCALMKGAGKPAFIARWKKAVEMEPNEARRRQYRDWALVMTELTKWQPAWLKATEGWMERKSKLIEGWRLEGVHEGDLRTKRSDLLRVMERRLRHEVPEAIRVAVETTNDLGTLDKWLDAATDSDNLADLRKGMRLDK